ncbi:MAG: hypothetical protein ACYC3L_13455 [Gemmatimonadaceae bacterium]
MGLGQLWPLATAAQEGSATAVRHNTNENLHQFPAPRRDSLADRYIERVGPIIPDLVDVDEIETMLDMPDGLLIEMEERGVGPRALTVNKPTYDFLYALADVQAWWDKPGVRHAIAFFQHGPEHNASR